MTKEAEPYKAAKQEAKAQGLYRYIGHRCLWCGENVRFVHSNACANCKRIADRNRYRRINDVMNHYETGNARISDEENRKFLSALAKEKAKTWDD